MKRDRHQEQHCAKRGAQPSLARIVPRADKAYARGVVFWVCNIEGRYPGLPLKYAGSRPPTAPYV